MFARTLLFCSAFALLGCQSPHPDAAAAAQTSSAAGTEQDERMAWWRDARFGMFIHWGLYAIPAGKWGAKDSHGEWIRTTAQIPLAEYDKLQPQWNPTGFDADAWAQMAAAAGMKYLVITSKHHDGFCLWDSAKTDWDVGNTPHGRDILRELSEACARHGVKFCTYHSIMDWHHPDYLPRRPWEKDRSSDGADFDRFEQYLHAQVTEVVQNYRPGVMWFDGEWESTWSHERGLRLFELCRSLDPAMIVNNRVDVHRGGMQGFAKDSEAVGDFQTPEQEIPPTGVPGVDWESCMTMNSHWGWNAQDGAWKSTTTLLHNLIDIASKGGNYLLNVGPRADGTFPPQAVQRLAEIGAWMQQHGEAIRGTTASVFDDIPWGRCTVRRQGETTKLYFHVLDWPKDGLLELPAFANEPSRLPYLLGAPSTQFLWHLSSTWEVLPRRIQVPTTAPDPHATVIVVEIPGAPIVHKAPTITAESDVFVQSVTVALRTPTQGAVVRYTTDGSPPSPASAIAADPLVIAQSCVLKARTFVDSDAVAQVVERTFTKVEPLPAVEPVANRNGLHVTQHSVDWQRIPDDRSALAASAKETGATDNFSVGKQPGEHVARRYTGFVQVPADDYYRFEVSSDDGSKLWIGGQLVVDNDGLHAERTQRGGIALAKGLHAIELVWFNRTGGAALGVKWARLGEPLRELSGEPLRH